jgi:fatty aldehyde-generating acyl-ACP reductase
MGAALHRLSTDEADFVVRSCKMHPFVIGEIRFGFAPYHGELLCVVTMPETILTPAGQRSIVAATEVAAARGARVLGLGGLTGPATGAGLRLLRHLADGVTLTNGNAYTAAVVRANVLEVVSAANRTERCRVAVVGCTGSVGVAASGLLADAGLDLILVGRTAARARSALSATAPGATFAGDVSAVRDADIVVLLTSEPLARLTPAMVAPDAVVIDFAQPLNIARSSRASFRKRGVLVVDGGVVRIPAYSCSYDLDMPDRGDAFACLAETFLFAREGIREHSVGRPTIDAARRMERIAAKHGVVPRPLEPELRNSAVPEAELVAAAR